MHIEIAPFGSLVDYQDAHRVSGYVGTALYEFVAGVFDGEWLSMEDMPCWPNGHLVEGTPYEYGRMHGWFDGPQPPNAKQKPLEIDWSIFGGGAPARQEARP